MASRYALNCRLSLETHWAVGVLGRSVLPHWLSSFISFTPDTMWFIEISLGSINYGSEPPYSVFFLFLPLFIRFLVLKLSNQPPLGSLLSKGQLEMAGKRVLPKHERKVRRNPQPSCRGNRLPACFSLRLDYTEGKERTRKNRIYIARGLCRFKQHFMYCFLGAA